MINCEVKIVGWLTSVSAYTALASKHGVIVAISCKHLLTKMLFKMHKSTPFQMKNSACSPDPIASAEGYSTPLPCTPHLFDAARTSAPCFLSGPHTFGRVLPAPRCADGSRLYGEWRGLQTYNHMRAVNAMSSHSAILAYMAYKLF